MSDSCLRKPGILFSSIRTPRVHSTKFVSLSVRMCARETLMTHRIKSKRANAPISFSYTPSLRYPEARDLINISLMRVLPIM